MHDQPAIPVLALSEWTSLLLGGPPFPVSPAVEAGPAFSSYLEGILRAEWWGWGSLQWRPRA